MKSRGRGCWRRSTASPVLRTCGCVGLIGLGLIELWLSCCAGVAWGLGASRGASTTTTTAPATGPLRPAQRREAAGGAAAGGQPADLPDAAAAGGGLGAGVGGHRGLRHRARGAE